MRLPANSHNGPETLERYDGKGDEQDGAPEPPTARVL